MGTVRSFIWYATEAQAATVAESLRLRCISTTHTPWSIVADLQAEWEKTNPRPAEVAYSEAELELPYEQFNKLPKRVAYLKAFVKWDKKWETKLAHMKAEGKVPKARCISIGDCELWEDQQTGGGGCRISWYKGLAWVSAHYGYAWADITDKAMQMFADMGCQPVKGSPTDPRCGTSNTDRTLHYYTREGD